MSVHLQKIIVGFEYPVYFTSDLFAVRNLDLVEAVARKEPCCYLTVSETVAFFERWLLSRWVMETLPA